ncbi:protein STICHEL [Salix suchowensis]|nr:protein STICHEL [Salix suchowensis]
MLCGSQSLYHRRRRSWSISNKRRIGSRTGHVLLPLLTNSGDGIGGSSIGTGLSDDELSTNYGELDLEALSRLDGRRWSSCRSQDGLEIVALNGDGEEEGSPENIRSLSQKYKPVFFSELIGQNIVVQSLANAISRGRIAPVYLFQGPRTRDLLEVDGTDKKGIDKVRYLLKKISHRPPLGSSHYKVFLIDECHLLPSKMWLAFLKFLEEPPQRVVFIFVTTDPDNVPRTVQSRCQKYLFNKIKDGDIVASALDLIALNADGSLRDAETMLDQLSLLGKKITTSLVNELVGVVSDEKLLELLGLAMVFRHCRDSKKGPGIWMDSGVDPMVLMSQMASLIMDLIAGTYNVLMPNMVIHSLVHKTVMTEAELERLKHALRLLSEAEKQLRISSDRSTWFTATLLQLGSTTSMDLTQSSSSRRQSSRTTEEDPSSASKESNAYKPKSDAQYLTRRSNSPPSLYREINGCSSHQGQYGFNAKPPRSQLVNSHTSLDDEITGNLIFRYKNSEKLDDIWEKCIEKCHSQTLRQLLHAHGKLLSISEVDGALAVYVAFEDQDIKARAERFLSSITNSIEIVLRRNVEVRIILVSDGLDSVIYVNQSELQEGHRQADTTLAIELGKKANCSSAEVGYSDLDLQEFPKLSKGSFNDVNAENSGERKQEMPMQRIESIIREQRLETAWLQAAEKGTPGSLSRLKPEKNQVLPQEDTYQQSQIDSIGSVVPSSQTWEDELNHELKVLKMQNRRVHHKDQIGDMSQARLVEVAVDFSVGTPTDLIGKSIAVKYCRDGTR